MPVQWWKPSSGGIQYEATHTALDKHLTAEAPLLHVQPLILQNNRSLGKKKFLLLFA